MSDIEKAKSMIQAVYDDGFAEINGREYTFTKTVHKKRRKVFAFYTSIQSQLQNQDFSFLDLDKWAEIETLLGDIILFDGVQINKRPNHWEEFPQDFIGYVGTALPVICYPFLGVSSGD